MDMGNDNIELRSEKVRKLLGEIPPTLVRIGIWIIVLVIVMLLVGLYFYQSMIQNIQ